MNAFHALLVTVAGACALLASVFYKYYYRPPEPDEEDQKVFAPVPPEVPQAPETAPEPLAQAQQYPDARVQPPVDKVRVCALAQQSFEGWYLPGSTHGGVYYPNGSPSYQRKNPGNIKQKDPDGSTSFIVFPTEASGLAALEAYIRRVIAGGHTAYPKGGATTIMEYAHIYTGDSEPAPTNYGKAIAAGLGVPTSTPMSYLLS